MCCNARPEVRRPSINGREWKKKKFVSSFSASEMPCISNALQHRQNELVVIDILWPAHRNAEVDRLERGRVAALAVIGLLERECLLNRQFARNVKPSLGQFLIPAHAGAA